ncbi:hypothetical protein HDV05_001328, partial [Chytridiales sp. JEL 0842]
LIRKHEPSVSTSIDNLRSRPSKRGRYAIGAPWERFDSTLLSVIQKETALNIDLWADFRRNRITATLFHDIRRNSKPLQLVASKFSKRIMKKAEHSNWASARWGHEVEESTREWYKRNGDLQTGELLQSGGLFILKEHQRVAASPDGVFYIGDTISRVLEVKGVGFNENAVSMEALIRQKHGRKEFPLSFADDGATICLKKDHKFYDQVQGQMGVVAVESCTMVFCTGVKGEHRFVLGVPFDAARWEEILTKVLELNDYLETFQYLTPLGTKPRK